MHSLCYKIQCKSHMTCRNKPGPSAPRERHLSFSLSSWLEQIPQSWADLCACFEHTFLRTAYGSSVRKHTHTQLWEQPVQKYPNLVRDFTKGRHKKRVSNLIMGFDPPILQQLCLFSWVFKTMLAAAWACACTVLALRVCVSVCNDTFRP